MGSGGPRGLQILLSDAKTIRGGFDSHTFPPVIFPIVGRARNSRVLGTDDSRNGA